MKQKVIFSMLAIFINLFAVSVVQAHGDDKPGPNGGLMFMPAGFHVEVVRTGENSVDFYLSDMEFKNPITENSSVLVEVVRGQKYVGMICSKAPTHFSCRLSKKESKEKGKGTLKVLAVRDGAKGNSFEVAWPLAKASVATPVKKRH